VVEQNTDLGHMILLSNIRILARKSRGMDQIMSEAEEIELHPNNVNGVDDYYLSRSRKPAICHLKGKRQHAVSKNKTVILTLLIGRRELLPKCSVKMAVHKLTTHICPPAQSPCCPSKGPFTGITHISSTCTYPLLTLKMCSSWKWLLVAR
jgi:hypothetical protein